MDGITRDFLGAGRFPTSGGVLPFALAIRRRVLAARFRGASLSALAVGLLVFSASHSAFAQAAGGGLGTHLGNAAGAEFVNLDVMFAVLKYLLAGAAGVGAAYYLWAIAKRNHHSGAHAGMVACAALAAFIAVSWGQTIQAGVQTLWQAAPDITQGTAVALEQW